MMADGKNHSLNFPLYLTICEVVRNADRECRIADGQREYQSAEVA